MEKRPVFLHSAPDILHPGCVFQQPEVSLSIARYSADNGGMDNLTSLATLLVAGVGLGLYIMRRRSRLGKRTPRF